MASLKKNPTVPSFLLALILFGFNLEALIDGARVLSSKQTSMEFIRSSCSTTTYPALCFSTLSAYTSKIQTSPMQMAGTALSVSLAGARSASAAMKTMSSSSGRMSGQEAGAMSDCMENASNSVDQLQESLGAMGRMTGKDRGFQLSSIRTWISAALTDYDTCMDGFAGSAMDGAVRSRLLNATHLASNALALFSCLALTSSTSSQASPPLYR